LINITAGENISLLEVNEACTIIQESAHEDANIIFGAVINSEMTEEIRVTVIATGFDKQVNLSPTKSPMKSRYAEQDVFKIKTNTKIISPTPTQAVYNEPVNTPSILADKPLAVETHSDEVHFDDTDAMRLDIDKKIDEALDLAERVQLHDGSDDLDVPSFLRKEEIHPL